MAYKKPPNLNTKYGRRRARQEAWENYQKMTPEQKAEHDQMGCFITLVILIVVGGLIYLVAGPKALLKWLSH
ncbi:hypothetical protein OCK74_01625 [Chitinophagaceae bacterium LB-8]|uniref:Uncharacterized protein n=1 Tax=Paraflavisolibacter caeni TaxID=2982496 RepID=A0A9X2XRX4_9BACT|nr:hypothetical protein [Paraflavisolibacter caeni]MCU7547789.1 hypothetical protein [Paraflavisolibacter caeni]